MQGLQDGCPSHPPREAGLGKPLHWPRQGREKTPRNLRRRWGGGIVVLFMGVGAGAAGTASTGSGVSPPAIVFPKEKGPRLLSDRTWVGRAGATVASTTPGKSC